jgi:hypothetical protein
MPHADTDVKLVVAPVATTAVNAQSAAAAWLMSNVAVDGDRVVVQDRRQERFPNARRAMQGPAFIKITTEYKMSAGMWATDDVLLLEQLAQSLADVGRPHNTQVSRMEFPGWFLLLQKPGRSLP